jgi:Fur family ferric uptake transcriptional regulator
MIAARDRGGRSQRGHYTGLVDRLRQAGQRMTPQRALILDAFTPGAHHSADEVCTHLEGIAPEINRSTVYRTLELFRDIGLISETDLGSGIRHYELLDDERHHHLVCRQCQRQIDLDDALVAPLRDDIRQRYGFEPMIDHLAVFGSCDACRGAG